MPTVPILAERFGTVVISQAWDFGSEQLDALFLVAVPQDKNTSSGLLFVDERIQPDRSVHDVRLREAGAFVSLPEIISSLGDQADRDPFDGTRLYGVPTLQGGHVRFVTLCDRICLAGHSPGAPSVPISK